MIRLRRSRKEKLLRHVRAEGMGLEIGPSFRPTAAKRDGYRVHVVDHLDREQLIEKYQHEPVATESIEEVDFVWHGEPYAELTGRTKFYDWIIASHVIEHTPDLIGFLNDCDSILKDDGILSLAVPDKRFCFDHFRPSTGIAKVLDAHFPPNVRHTLGTVVEQNLYAVSKGGKGCWNRTPGGIYQFINPIEIAREPLKEQTTAPASSDPHAALKEYQDCHAWCFSPHSFRLMMHDLHLLGLIALREVSYLPTHGCEFFVTLGCEGTGPKQDRLALLKMIQRSESLWGEMLSSFWGILN